MDWINVSCDLDKWWAGVNTVMNLKFLKMCEISWLTDELLACEEWFLSM